MSRLWWMFWAVLMLGLTAPGASAAVQPYGVWRGTLGAQQVVVNIQPARCGSSYYYLRHRVGIPLRPPGQPAGPWHEGWAAEAGPAWALTRVTATTLAGEWTDAQGQHPQPLRLQKIASGASSPQACDGPAAQSALRAYNAPRLAALAPKVAADSFEHRAYRSLFVPGVDIGTVQLPSHPQPVPRLNQYLRQWLDERVLEYYECLEGGAEAQAKGGIRFDPGADYHHTHIPVFWNAHLLALNEQWGNNCSTYRGTDFSIASDMVWDLDTDQPLALAAWFRPADQAPDDPRLPAGLMALVLTHYAQEAGEEDECVAWLRTSADYALSPRTEGLVFTPGTTQGTRGCERPTLVPWPELKPFLTPAGAQAVRKKVLEGGTP